jgi:hypothetical protein
MSKPKNHIPLARGAAMIRIAITEAALVAIAKTLPEETVLQVDRRGGQCFIHLKEAMADRLGAMRGPGESYSDVIVRPWKANERA